MEALLIPVGLVALWVIYKLATSLQARTATGGDDGSSSAAPMALTTCATGADSGCDATSDGGACGG